MTLWRLTGGHKRFGATHCRQLQGRKRLSELKCTDYLYWSIN